MKGEKIKEILRIQGFLQNQVARAIGESSQNLSAALRSDDIKTGLVERIAEATGLSICHFYGDSNIATATGDHAQAVLGNNNQVNEAADFLKEIAAQRQMTEKVLDQNTTLLRIVDKMSNR